MKKLAMIVAVDQQYGIGIDNKLPWGHIKDDMLWFKEKTKDKMVIMGSSTWDSLPKKPLPNRINVVLSSRDDIEGADLVMEGAPETVMTKLSLLYPDQEKIIMGGAKVYQAFLPLIDVIYLTRVKQVCDADTFLNIDELMSNDFILTETQEMDSVIFEVWKKK